MRDETIRISEKEMKRQAEFAALVGHHPARPSTYYIVTYGCQMNAHDSEKLAGMLEQMGMEAADDSKQADLVLFNTCCVRDNAERKALGNVTWLNEVKKKRPDMLIGVCGCMVQESGMAQKILKQYPFIDIAFGTGNLYALPEYLYRALETRGRVVAVDEKASTVAEGVPILRTSANSAYITVMYGCNNFCSYCIVPYVRGRERSRAWQDVVREAEELKARGVKEIMLLGQNVNSYGLDMEDGISFAQLLRKVAATGIPRIRFMTSHPKDLSDELIDVLATEKNLCPHFHLPVQSGSNRILELMNRHYTREKYLERVEKLRAAVPDIGLTTDLIVAFPGETEEDFEETLDLVRRVRYDSAFTFIYSPRSGTKAEKMDGRIPEEVAASRIDRLIRLQESITKEKLKEKIGSVQSVLVDGVSRRSDSQVTGKCGNGMCVNFDGNEDMVGQIVDVIITDAGSNTLRGQLIKNKGETRMNEQVIEKAKELAKVISESKEFITMRLAEDAAEQSEELTNAYARYTEKHNQVEALSMEDKPDFEKMGELSREMDEIQAEMKKIPMMDALQSARGAFTEMMQQVNYELQKVLAPEQEESDGCSGSCEHCHGCH